MLRYRFRVPYRQAWVDGIRAGIGTTHIFPAYISSQKPSYRKYLTVSGCLLSNRGHDIGEHPIVVACAEAGATDII